MERLRQLLNQISTQLGQLTLSQRLAMGLSAALIVVSLLWLMQWSVAPNLVPLVNHDFSFDELDAAESTLRSSGLPYDVRGRRLYVRSVDRHNLLRQLHASDALPEGSLYDMATVVSDDNPFENPQARIFKQNYAKGNELAKIIATSPFVKKAAVVIQDEEKRRLSGRSHEKTASVTVALVSGQEMTPSIVEGFAKLVAGAVAGLKPHNVYITDSRHMRSHSLPDPADPGSVDTLTLIKQREAHFVSKIMDKLADIPGLRASVTVDVDTSKRSKSTRKYDDPEPKTETTETMEQGSGNQPAETGVQPNLGQAVVANNAGGGQSSERTDNENFPPTLTETETIEQMPYSTKRVTATVGIPRGFVVGVYRLRHTDGQENPSDVDEKYVAVRDEQLARVRSSVTAIIQAKSADDVQVDVYPDMSWSAEGAGWADSPGEITSVAAQQDPFSAVDWARTYGPQVGLGILALISVTFLTRIVRASSEAIAGASSAESGGDADLESEEILLTGASAVGSASVSSGFLVGRELGVEAARVQELNEEVAKMVDTDPEGTAGLLSRWIDEPG